VEKNLFASLRDACIEEWGAYIDHPFVRGIADGTLPETSFRHYLIQDYLFLIQFARAYGLAVYKSQNLDEIREAAESIRVISDVEMRLHVDFCRDWGVKEEDMQCADEAEDTMAYTRYVLERGLSGDLLDLHVALAPCMFGYAVIGKNLMASPDTILSDNPYRPWIEMYASDEYQEVMVSGSKKLDKLFESRAGEGRMPDLIKTFRQATRLEIRFWQMGMDAI
jgi:thiaminase (transcriptional activator TenA)